MDYSRSLRVAASFGLLLAFGASAGCWSGHVSYPYSPVPVLLSRVDRIGSPGPSADGQRAQPVAAVTGTVTTETLGSGGGDFGSYVQTTSTDPGFLTGQVLQHLPRGREVERGEVRLDEVQVSSYAAFHLFLGANGFTGVPRGTVVRLP